MAKVKAKKTIYGRPAHRKLYPVPSLLNKIKGAMRENDMTLERAAALLGHSVNYVRARLAGDFSFGVDEAVLLGKEMGLSGEEISYIFLGIGTETAQDRRRGA